jgi:hypothetical protein
MTLYWGGIARLQMAVFVCPPAVTSVPVRGVVQGLYVGEGMGGGEEGVQSTRRPRPEAVVIGGEEDG